MTDQKKTKAELIAELQEARLDNFRLKTLLEKNLSSISQNEDALNEPRKLLHDVQKLAKIGLWEWNKATDNVTWSDELFRLLQRDPAEGAPSYAEHPRFYAPDDMQRLGAAVEEALKGLGVTRTLRKHLENIYDLERLTSKISMGHANARDLTALKQSLMALPGILATLDTFDSHLFIWQADSAVFSELAALMETLR